MKEMLKIMKDNTKFNQLLKPFLSIDNLIKFCYYKLSELTFQFGGVFLTFNL
jgi:hypothetical protein